MSNEIICKATADSSLPALFDGENLYFSIEDKSNLLAKAFSAKFTIPAVVANKFTYFCKVSFSQEFIPVRTDNVAKFLENIDPDNATGPDRLSGRSPEKTGV